MIEFPEHRDSHANSSHESSLDENWWADSMECYTYLRNVQDLLSDGKRPHLRDVLENHSKDQSFRMVHWLSITSISAKDESRIHQFGNKVLPGLFLGYALYAGGIWKGDILVADIEELEKMDASEIYLKRLNAKEVIFPKQGEFTFPIADGRIKTPGGDQELRTSPFDTGPPKLRRKSRRFSRRIRRVSS